MALTVERPVAAVQGFFIAVILVILATYLLFNAGSITFLRFLKGRKSYYYKPENFISVSNLIARMRKMQRASRPLVFFPPWSWSP